MLADGLDLVMDLVRSHGNWIVDRRDGSEYLDLYTMYASQAVGYNHPKMLEFSDEFTRVAIQKPACSEIYTVEMVRFMEIFERVAMPAYLPHVFFIEGGALAVENALKAAFDWKTRLNRAGGKDGRHADLIIHFKEAFHGRSGYTLSLTNTHNPDKTRCFRDKVLVVGCGPSSVRFRPHLIVKETEIDHGLEVMAGILERGKL